MSPRILRSIGIWGLMLSLQNGAPPASDTTGADAGFLAGMARVLPPAVLSVEAEDGEVETMLSITILDRMPDLRGAAASVRRLLARR